MKRVFAILLALALLGSLCIPVLAAGEVTQPQASTSLPADQEVTASQNWVPIIGDDLEVITALLFTIAGVATIALVILLVNQKQLDKQDDKPRSVQN